MFANLLGLRSKNHGPKKATPSFFLYICLDFVANVAAHVGDLGTKPEAFAHSLMSRFREVDAVYEVRSFVSDEESVAGVVDEVRAAVEAGKQPLVFSTLTDPTMRDRLRDSGAFVLGLFDYFVDDLANELGSDPSSEVGSLMGLFWLCQVSNSMWKRWMVRSPQGVATP